MEFLMAITFTNISVRNGKEVATCGHAHTNAWKAQQCKCELNDSQSLTGRNVKSIERRS
jgi:hypothetical protein